AVSSVLTAMSQRASRPEKNQRHASTRMLPSPGLAPGIAVANGISDSRMPRATAREANTAMTDSFRTPANSGYDCIRPRLPSGIAGDVHEHPMGQARDRFMEVADAAEADAQLVGAVRFHHFDAAVRDAQPVIAPSCADLDLAPFVIQIDDHVRLPVHLDDRRPRGGAGIRKPEGGEDGQPGRQNEHERKVSPFQHLRPSHAGGVRNRSFLHYGLSRSPQI